MVQKDRRYAVVELNYHEEYLKTILRLLGNKHVDVFTTPQIATRVREIYDETENINFIYNFTMEDIQGYDYIFFNTIRPSMLDMQYWRHFKKQENTKIFLTIHNLNAWGKSNFRLRKNILHSIDSYIVSKHLRAFLEMVDVVIVASSTLYLQAK